MDEYGCMQLTKEDASEVKLLLEGYSPVVFALDCQNGGAMIVLLVSKFTKLGKMPFGGNPEGQVYVGIWGKGCGHLERTEQHPDYISEKLNLSKPDAMAFVQFWNLMWV